MRDKKGFFFCPFCTGILVIHPDDPLCSLPVKDFERRSGRDRRINKYRSEERRVTSIPVCPAYKTAECIHLNDPEARSHPLQLLSQCRRKFIERADNK
jgi:hypothetical protein